MRLFCYEPPIEKHIDGSRRCVQGEYIYCSSCSCPVSKVYVLADSQKEADLWRENDVGLCADCMVDHIKDMDIRKVRSDGG